MANHKHPDIYALMANFTGNSLLMRDGSVRRFGVPSPNSKCKCGSERKSKRCCNK